MLIIRRLNCIDAGSGIVTLSKWLSGAQVERELRSLSTCGHYVRLYEDARSTKYKNVHRIVSRTQ